MRNLQPTKHARRLYAFTLPELLIAVSIFAVVATVVSQQYVIGFNESRKSNYFKQIYDDGQFILARIAQEVRSGMVDYDEYYNQNVISGNYGQNYGRYFSSFYHPGADGALGFDCNDGTRNSRDCTLLRKTLDENTGTNPFSGKASGAASEADENAFCGTWNTNVNTPLNNSGSGCDSNGSPLPLASQSELYLISADGFRKTILSRERIGGTQANPIYSLSMLRLKGNDIDGDEIADRFVCDDDFQCRGSDDVPDVESVSGGVAECASGAVIPGELPRPADKELNPSDADFAAETCDTVENGFSRDFVPISPFRVNVKHLSFFISPAENPHYAFAEVDEQSQPSVTIMLTIEVNPEKGIFNNQWQEVTFIETVEARSLSSIPAPLFIE